MLIKFETPFEDLGGLDAFDTDAANHEDMVVVCAALAQAVDRLKKDRAETSGEPGSEPIDNRKLAAEIGVVVAGARVSQAVAIDALTIAAAAVFATLDHLPPKEMNRAVAMFAAKVLELALHFQGTDRSTSH
jgi:hypothetical protein